MLLAFSKSPLPRKKAMHLGVAACKPRQERIVQIWSSERARLKMPYSACDACLAISTFEAKSRMPKSSKPKNASAVPFAVLRSASAIISARASDSQPPLLSLCLLSSLPPLLPFLSLLLAFLSRISPMHFSHTLTHFTPLSPLALQHNNHRKK